ncbi:MAG: winged helix-turn-helix transcriptional regulator [Phycisphaeraceae bacterium]|nr:winged helix-turn-helix transcriptional regulator [Phycisphaeraceae bacterium]
MAGFAKIALVMRHEAWRSAGRRGLTPTQAQILSVLGSAREPIGLTEVASRMAISLATASEALSSLVSKGLVRKSRSEADARAIVLTLTRQGIRESSKAGEWPDSMLEAARSLPEQERAALLRGLIGMIRELQERGSIPTARMCVGCTYFRPNEYPGAPRPHHCLLIDAPIADADLRIDCAEMEPAEADLRPRLWNVFVNGTPLDHAGPGRRRSPSESRRNDPSP